MRALGKLPDGGEQPADLLAVGRMAEDRQAEGRLGDEDVAGDRLEAGAGRVAPPLVVARRDDARAAMLDGDLRRAQHMAGRMEGDGHAVDGKLFSESPRPASCRQSPRRSAAP